MRSKAENSEVEVVRHNSNLTAVNSKEINFRYLLIRVSEVH